MSTDNGSNNSDRIELDDSGFPILLATRAPGQVAAQPDPSGAVVVRGARSGNTKADPVTGRFAGGKSTGKPDSQDDGVVKQSQVRTLPQGVTQEQWERRQDIVRQLAREFDDLSDGDIKDFLKGHPNVVMSQVNIDVLKMDVRAQRLDDLVDILDSQLRTKVTGMLRSRRFVKLSAPKGFQKRVFQGLNDDEVLHLVKRLEGKGWDPADLTKNVISRITDEGRRTKLEQLYGEQKPKSGRKAQGGSS